MLGVSKKGRAEPPKSIQLAAAAAKKVTVFYMPGWWTINHYPVFSNRRNRIVKRPVLKIWKREGRQYFKRRLKKGRLRQMKRKRRQGKTSSAAKRNARKIQVNVRLSGQIRRLVSRQLHKCGVLTSIYNSLLKRTTQRKER
jgi:hypothetical protein